MLTLPISCALSIRMYYHLKSKHLKMHPGGRDIQTEVIQTRQIIQFLILPCPWSWKFELTHWLVLKTYLKTEKHAVVIFTSHDVCHALKDFKKLVLETFI